MKTISFKTAFAIVLGAHLLAIFLIMFSTTNVRAADQKFLQSKEAQFAGIEVPAPTPTPSPALVNTNKVKQMEPKKVNNDYPSKPEVIVVQKGDTIYKISKKYSVSVDNIMKINNIKDKNKILLGQKLKLK
jgi:LysM repeat protein